MLVNFGIPDATANGAILLKQTYLRYLDPYEKIYFLGEEEDRDDDWYNDEEESRSRRQKAQKIQSTVPLSYNHRQHEVHEDHRKVAGLSTNIYKKTDYDRLALSLTSPLPNEQDFGINVCTLLSNEGKHTLKLGKCPRLVDLLLAHAGVFNHRKFVSPFIWTSGIRLMLFCFSDNLEEYLNDIYAESRDYNILEFWGSVCRDWSVRNLMLHPSTTTAEIRKRRTKCRKSSTKSATPDKKTVTSEGSRQLTEMLKRAEREMGMNENDETDELFASGPGNGTRELAGQRVLQVATILRNLSFEEDNASVLSKNLTCLRFCLLCTSSQWSNLNQMGFDILSNIASEVDLERGYTDSCITDCFLSLIANCIASEDRFQVVSSLDVLTKLCQYEPNEAFICDVITDQQSPVYDYLVKYLSLHDIHLLISTLECMYALSSLGESTCNSIVRTHGALEALVSLVTVEAQSYGPKACILMRVVETVPGSTMSAISSGDLRQVHSQQVISQPAQLTQLQAVQPNAVTNQEAIQRQLLQSSPVITSVQNVANRASSPHVVNDAQTVQIRGGQIVQIQRSADSTQQPTLVATSQAAGGQMVVVQQNAQQPQHQQQQRIIVSQPQPIIQQQAKPVQQPALQQPQQQPHQQQQPQGSQQVQLRVANDEVNRQFCLSWLKATYEPFPGSCIDQQVMYKQYLASLHKLGKRDVISGQHYVLAVRYV